MEVNGNSGSAAKSIVSQNDDWNKSAKELGGTLSDLEDDLIAAYSAGKDSKEAKALAKKYNVKDGSLEGIQQVISLKFNRVLRAFTAFDNVIKSIHETMMRVINNIR